MRASARIESQSNQATARQLALRNKILGALSFLRSKARIPLMISCQFP